MRSLDLASISYQLERADVKTIVSVLQHAKSSYLKLFNDLANQIIEGSVEAKDNLMFLQCLSEPCGKLAQSKPKDISEHIPQILKFLNISLVRMISTLSQHFNTPKPITDLLSKISNEIILRCCEHIDLKEIFARNIEVPIKVLQESIKSGDGWKHIYRENVRRMRITLGENA